MPYVLGIFKVKDFETWKSGFTAPDSVAWRKRDGGDAYRIFRSEEDPHTAVVYVQWDSLENARKHAQSQDLRRIHEQVLAAPPEVYFLELVDERSA
jgi:quinol monooxygenase YgiN